MEQLQSEMGLGTATTMRKQFDTNLTKPVKSSQCS